MTTATLPKRHPSSDAAQAPHTSGAAPSSRDQTAPAKPQVASDEDEFLITGAVGVSLRDYYAQALHASGSAPSSHDLTTLEPAQLLVLLEVHHTAGEKSTGEPCEVFCIAMALAHRLGIGCEAYVRLMIGALTVAEWRGFFAEDGSPAFALR